MLRVATFLVVVVLANLPVLNDLRIGHELDRDGRTVQARVETLSTTGGRHLALYSVPGTRQLFTAAIDDDAAARARFTDRLAVRVLPDRPEVNQPLGRADGIGVFYVIAAVADLVLLLVAAVAVGRRVRRRSTLQM